MKCPVVQAGSVYYLDKNHSEAVYSTFSKPLRSVFKVSNQVRYYFSLAKITFLETDKWHLY